MKQILLTAMMLLILCSANAQDSTSKALKSMLSEEKFDEIIAQYALAKDLSAKSLYYVGLAYYMKEDHALCHAFMDKSIAKDPADGRPHRIHGKTYIYERKFADAAKSFQSAVILDSMDGDSFVGLGDAYYEQKQYQAALTAFKKAIELQEVPPRAYSMLAQTYLGMDEKSKALEAYYVGKANLSKESPSYRRVLYNIGLLEVQHNNYDKAEVSYNELHQLDPKDFRVYAKLIQIHYHRGDYEKALPLRTKLYEAYANGELKESFEGMFCFDQFKWKDMSIQAYEVFKIDTTRTDSKHRFYVENADGETEFLIQTEYSPVLVEMGGLKYLLCMVKDHYHATYNVGFDDNFDYDQMKQAVIDILEGKLAPGASSQPTK